MTGKNLSYEEVGNTDAQIFMYNILGALKE